MESVERIEGINKIDTKMNQQRYNHMVDMLTQATMLKIIKWQEDKQHHGFFTIINQCIITISSVYDITMEETSYTLTLANPDNEVFSTYSFSDTTDKEEYDRLKSLYVAVRDILYRITESENLIVQGLESALANQKNGADNLPF